MTIQYHYSGADTWEQRAEKLRLFKNEYVKARREIEELGSVKLTFSEPTTLHTTNRYRDDVTATEHIVKGLFFLNDGVANCESDPESGCDGAYYTPKRRRSSGFSLPMATLESVTLIPKTIENSDYSKQWQSIADSMKKYNINPKVVEAIEAHLRGETPHIMGFQNYWKRTDKPRTLSFADVLQQVVGWPDMERGKSYPHKEWQKIHSDHIKNFAIERMKSRASKANETAPYAWYQASRDGMKRDRSVSIQVYDNGDILYTAASEYAGCGNGDYYVMYSPTMAFYAETD